MNIDVKAASQDLTANGGSDGYATITDSTQYYVGCYAYLCCTDQQVRCVITEIFNATKVGLRIVADDNENQKPVYLSRSNLSAFTTAKSSRLNMPAQLAKVDPQWSRPAATI